LTPSCQRADEIDRADSDRAATEATETTRGRSATVRSGPVSAISPRL
jgi:hypothetical protein